MIETSKDVLDDFFIIPNVVEYSIIEEIPTTERSKSYQIKLVTGEAFVENNTYKSKDFYRTRLKIEIIKYKEKYIVITNSISFDRSKSKQYEAIKLIKKSYNETYDCTIALVKIKKKWAILDLVKNELISDVEFEDAIFHKKFDDVLILKNKSKIGIYLIKDDNETETPLPINPEYDSLSNIEWIYSLDDNYKSIKIFYLVERGMLCPVGSNGIKYYKN